jgi:hypothetical protein
VFGDNICLSPASSTYTKEPSKTFQIPKNTELSSVQFGLNKWGDRKEFFLLAGLYLRDNKNSLIKHISVGGVNEKMPPFAMGNGEKIVAAKVATQGNLAIQVKFLVV